MKTNQEVAVEVILGKWGNGADRRSRLTRAGYNYENVQSIVNALCSGDMTPMKEEPEKIIVTGTETLDIEIDLSKYCGLNITFISGGDLDADSDS